MKKNKGIPRHGKCTNCGQCCGPIPIGDNELKKIIAFLKNVPESEKERLRNQPREYLTCEFRDTEKNNCFIYEVRPTICRLFGVTAGLDCPNGNSYNINGREHVLKIKNGKLRKIL